MSARESILGRIRALNIPDQPLPAMPVTPPFGDLSAFLMKSFEKNLCTVLEATAETLDAVIRAAHPQAGEIYSTVLGVTGNILYDPSVGPAMLGNLDLAVVRAEFAVAENGALWIGRDDLQVPAACFIGSALAVVLDRSQVVADMHAAYERVKFDRPFGVFIAGPSRTADIEQSLVIGAHGPLSMTVVLV